MRVRGVSFNLYSGNSNPRRNLILLVTFLLFPRFLILQEAKNFKGSIPGYTAYRAPRHVTEGPDDQNTMFLVRKGTKVVEEDWESVPKGAWQYEDRPRKARVYGRLTLSIKNKLLDIYGVHRCPLGPNPPRPVNRSAWIAEHVFLCKWDRDRTSVWGADWNTREDTNSKDDYSLSSLAHDLRARVHVIDIDGFLTTRDIVVNSVRKLSQKFGSDKHTPVVMDFKF